MKLMSYITLSLLLTSAVSAGETLWCKGIVVDRWMSKNFEEGKGSIEGYSFYLKYKYDHGSFTYVYTIGKESLEYNIGHIKELARSKNCPSLDIEIEDRREFKDSSNECDITRRSVFKYRKEVSGEYIYFIKKSKFSTTVKGHRYSLMGYLTTLNESPKDFFYQTTKDRCATYEVIDKRESDLFHSKVCKVKVEKEIEDDCDQGGCSYWWTGYYKFTASAESDRGFKNTVGKHKSKNKSDVSIFKNRLKELGCEEFVDISK